MTAIALLFITGALLLAAEVALPGAVAGILGGIALLVGSILTYSEFGALPGTLATVAALLLVLVMLYLELVWLPRTRVGRALVVEAAVDGQSQPPLASSEIVGRAATAETALVPTGYVLIDGRRYEAFCRTGHAVRGAALTVVGVDNFRLIVSETQTS
jgi:membrane-bound serine protease (ClpP class)